MKKIYSLLTAIAMIGFFTYCSSPQQDESTEVEVQVETYTFVEGHAPVWQEAINQVMDLADAMPEDMYTYRPHDSVRTFAQQLMHIGSSSKVLSNMFLKDIKPEGPPAGAEGELTKEEVKAQVRQGLEDTWEIMKTMSDQKLMENVQSFSGNTMTRLEGLLFVHDHLSNHKAKANLYVRISGNEPPSYRYY